MFFGFCHILTPLFAQLLYLVVLTYWYLLCFLLMFCVLLHYYVLRFRWYFSGGRLGCSWELLVFGQLNLVFIYFHFTFVIQFSFFRSSIRYSGKLNPQKRRIFYLYHNLHHLSMLTVRYSTNHAVSEKFLKVIGMDSTFILLSVRVPTRTLTFCQSNMLWMIYL